jgi:hypothetical protein
MTIGGVIIEEDQLVSNHRVFFSVYDGDICCSSVWRADFDGHVNCLAWGKGLNIRCVIGELVSLAKEQITSGWVIVFLVLSDLKFPLDISLIVGLLVVEYLRGS